MKRVLSVLSVLCLLLAFVPAAVTAETYQDLTYSVSGGKVTITDCNTSVAGAVTIPDTIAGYPVTAIATDAFAGCTGLTAITIGKNVTSIGNAAFSGCTGLVSISVASGNSVYHSAGNCLIETSSKTLVVGCKASVIPTDGTVTAIGNMAFYKCDSLTAITIPNNVVSIGASAFEGCTKLADVTIGSGVKTIGNSAFLNCTALAEVAIPDSVTTMGVYVFSGCTKLTSAVIGNQVAAIGNSAFAGCTALTDVTIGSNVETLYNIIQGKIEASEFIVKENSPIIDKPLSELHFRARPYSVLLCDYQRCDLTIIFVCKAVQRVQYALCDIVDVSVASERHDLALLRLGAFFL